MANKIERFTEPSAVAPDVSVNVNLNTMAAARQQTSGSPSVIAIKRLFL
ncbi:MAG: hypothetical protein ABJA18_00950 [bacterium]